jgi:putative ABC transport system permease protein
MISAGVPPKFLTALLARILPRDWREAGTGDFEEQYAGLLAERGRKAAAAWYAFQIVRTFPPFVFDTLRWKTIMFKNYLLITLRDIRKNKVSSVINIFGLAIGIACAFLLMLLVRYETSFDRFHKDADRIFRVYSVNTSLEKASSSPMTRDTLGPRLAADIPEVADSLRISRFPGLFVEAGDKRLMTDLHFADENFFRFFSFRLLQGDPASVLAGPDSAVISRSFSERMFGDVNPVGKVVTLHDSDRRTDLTISGVMRDFPPNSHLQGEFIVPLQMWKTRPEGESRSVATYLRLREAGLGPVVEAKLPDFIRRTRGDAYAQENSYRLQKLTDLHMHSDLDYEFRLNQNKVDPGLFKPLVLIALLVLLVAAINSINLATARASRRALEVGLRKVIGAGRGQLVRQFLAEAVILAFLSLAIGLLLAALALPAFNGLMAKSITLDFAVHLPLVGGLFALTLAVGILSGLYPAAFLATSKPAESLGKQARSGGRTGGRLRKSLVIVQFGVSVVFIILALTIKKQLAFIQTADLGFDRSHVLVFQINRDKNLSGRFDLVQKEFAQIPAVIRISTTSNYFGRSSGSLYSLSLDGTDKKADMLAVMTGADTFDFFGINMVQGPGFSGLTAEAMERKVIINESAARVLGLADPVGRRIRSQRVQAIIGIEEPLEIVGVVRDFHAGSLHDKIQPTIFYFIETPAYALVRIRAENIGQTMAGLKQAWTRLPTHLPFDPLWLDELLVSFPYREDRKAGKTFLFAALMSVGLACMGIYGTVAFTVGRRRREIGVRKVLGATERGILWMLLKEFSGPVVAAAAVAWPLGVFFSRKWLNGFAYRTGIGGWTILLSAGIVLAVALLSIVTQALRASRENPADTIRYE